MSLRVQPTPLGCVKAPLARNGLSDGLRFSPVAGDECDEGITDGLVGFLTGNGLKIGQTLVEFLQ